MSSLVLEKVGQLWLILTNFVFQKSFLSKRNYQSQKRLIGLLLGANPYTCIYALKYHTMLWCISSLCVQKMIMCFRNKAFLVFVKMYLYFYSLFTWPLQTISLVSSLHPTFHLPVSSGNTDPSMYCFPCGCETHDISPQPMNCKRRETIVLFAASLQSFFLTI